ncbi:uncharacterized protein At3g60930, chloroplastic-like [Eutrema salsugineum]|uniref:uncharacterized protein At3g60930, chloroplastic-like n=1 Tax=Eutrema salsugineum TaxID=72664 RepID=UPI000CED3571|nr:uncharacterized protein At3g60930, chloroplastic-like [Eutrema salsugineum]
MPRGLRHMIGILVRSYECRIDIELDHLLNLLEVRKAPGGKKFYISSKARRKIISGFPSKDSFWDECFFFVRVNGASVGDNFIRKTKTDWGPLVRDFLPRCPNDLFEVQDTLAANRTNWKRHFSLERVERARSIAVGVPVSSELSNSSGDTRDKMVMETFRERKKREAEEAARRAAEAAKRVEVEPKDAQQAGNEASVIGSGNRGNQSSGREDGEIAPEATSNVPDEQKSSADPTKSAILALPHSPRPPKSKLVKHEAMNRKRSAAEKGKGGAPDEGEPLKKRQKAAAGEVNPKKLVVDYAFASAQLFSKVNNDKVSLPRPKKLKRPKSYAAMLSTLLVGYESDALKGERRFVEAKQEVVQSKADLEKALARISVLEEEKGAMRAELEKATNRFEESRCRKNSEIASLKRQIVAKEGLLESRVKIAQKDARRAAAVKFQEKLVEIEGKMGELEKAKRDENDLGQIRSNLVLIGDLRKPDASLDAEEEKLKNLEVELLGAEETFERAATDLRERLVVSPVSPDSVDSRLGNEPLEVTAASVGVTNPTGSNIDTPIASGLAAEGVPELRAGDQ